LVGPSINKYLVLGFDRINIMQVLTYYCYSTIVQTGALVLALWALVITMVEYWQVAKVEIVRDSSRGAAPETPVPMGLAVLLVLITILIHTP
jgi:hypothetical protein